MPETEPLKLIATLAFCSTMMIAAPALAAIFPGDASPRIGQSDNLVRLAQARDAEVYYDENGNQVIVDVETGQIISVRPPDRRARREMQRDRRREQRRERLDGYYRDPELETYERARRYDERPPQEEFFPYDGPRRQAAPDDFPEPPRRRQQPVEPPAPRTRTTAVEREVAPLPETPTGREIIDENQGRAGKSIIEPGKPRDISPPVLSSARDDVAGLQILLDRAGASPGVIDGRFGSNVDKAIVNYRAITGQNLKSTDTIKIKELLAAGGDPFKDYEITPQDAAGPYVASVPEDYSEKAKLERLSFTSVTEALAERFHMDEAYLKALNPSANFNRAGTIIRVVNIGANVSKPVAKIIADKGNKQVRAYGTDGKLVAAYPTTIGSSETPSPTGVHAVSRVVFDPGYTYNPKINFKQGENDKVLSIPPGPNGPVGSIWIALDKPTYGIHGTPEPSKIGKTESHGCVRLTNWDAAELAKLVKPGVTVEFVE